MTDAHDKVKEHRRGFLDFFRKGQAARRVHNARAVLADYGELSEDLWRRFNSDGDQLWYYRTLTQLFMERKLPLAEELDRVVPDDEIRAAIDASYDRVVAKLPKRLRPT
jgi:hypothetical protein